MAALWDSALVVIPSTLFFAHVLDLRPIDALYFVWTTVMTVGYGDISLSKAPDAAKVVGMLLMLAGAAFVATLFAFLTGWVVTRRLDVLHGRVRMRGRGHVVIAGAGNLGLRVTTRLAAAGRRVVIVERDAGARNVAALRAHGHHVIVADATNEQVLDLAGVDQAGAILALTDSDAVNLQIALLVRARGGAPRVVMRVISPELSAHVTERGDGVALSPIAVAAKSFADAILAMGEREGRAPRACRIRSARLVTDDALARAYARAPGETIAAVAPDATMGGCAQALAGLAERAMSSVTRAGCAASAGTTWPRPCR